MGFKDAINNLPSLSETIDAHNLNPVKSLGQNFLLDLNITDKIVRFALNDHTDINALNVIEIGPGPGGLTRSLLCAGVRSVTAVEFDPRAVQALATLQDITDGHLKIVSGDALKTDVKTLCDAPRSIVANLPYNIATPLLIGWLKDLRLSPDYFSSMTLMFQKEVADRICSAPNTKSYGRLSVMSQFVCRAACVYILPPSAFTPPPKVDSAVVHFVPKKLEDNAPSFKSMELVTTAGFGARRKMIRQSLKAYKPYFEELGIAETLRAENLSVENFMALAKKHEERTSS